MSTPIDKLIVQIGEVGDTMQALSDKEALLAEYTAREQEYGALVASTKKELAELVASSENQLRDLNGAISDVYPVDAVATQIK